MSGELGIDLPRPKRHFKNGSPNSEGKDRPEFHFDFTGSNGFSRKAVEQWPIHGFADQEIEVDLGILASQAARPLSAAETDWVQLAAAIYAADRFANRRPGHAVGQTFWRRSIHLKVPVLDPTLWNKGMPSILSALSFLTDDDWTIHYIERRKRRGEEDQLHLHGGNNDQPAWVCLFSGGLDSLAGFKRLSSLPHTRGLLVSGWTHERLYLGQERIVSQLRATHGQPFEWLPVRYGFRKIVNSAGMESSQRSRGWIHVALGLAAVVASNRHTLDVCENGIGAFNLPTELSQTGSHTSRAMHPVFLRRIAQAASVVFDRELHVRQTAVFETKGELLSRTLRPSDSGLAAMTFSCEIFPNYHSKHPQCGVCPSCLVRRASLHSSGIEDPEHLYSLDVKTQHIPAKKALGLIKMERFTRRLARGFHPMSAADSAMWEYPEAGSYFKEAADSIGMNFDDFLTKLRRTHYNFVQEWEDFASNVPSLRQHRRSAA
jgi:hypothetical protein